MEELALGFFGGKAGRAFLVFLWKLVGWVRGVGEGVLEVECGCGSVAGGIGRLVRGLNGICIMRTELLWARASRIVCWAKEL